MKKTIIRLTENDLHNIVMNTVNRIITERHVLKVPHSDDGMDMMGMQDPNIGMGADPNMGMNDPSMGGDPNAMGGDDMDMEANGSNNPRMDNIQNILTQLNDDDLKAAEGYLESLLSDNEGVNNSNQDDMSDPSMGDADPNAMGGQPMQESFIKEFNNLAMMKRPEKRQYKKIDNPTQYSKINPFIVNR